jgi:hypothetical protein
MGGDGTWRRGLGAGVVVLVAMVASTAATAPASAQEMLRCTAANLGQRTCQVGNVCVCTYQDGKANRAPKGYAWDCGLGNGTCTAGTSYPPPQAYGYAPPVVVEGYTVGALGPEAIARLQQRLNDLGYDAGPADGVAGVRTRNAIRVYQEQQGLPIDGQPSPDLLTRLGRR